MITDDRARRLAAHEVVAARLAGLSDRELAERVASATALGTGIGGRSAELDVAGTRVFVKQVPLTDLELRNPHSTANLFGLPTWYQYGIGSAGFGAWRELAVHTMTTRWVVDGEYDGFPLTHHWRVLPGSAPHGFTDFLGGIDGAVAHWEGSAAVRGRLEAIGRASASLVLFLEHVPWTLSSWLADHSEAVPRVDRALARGAAFMGARGLVHFDAHFRNVLTDGRRLYFADFGLALGAGFDLSPAERDFLSRHLAYDRYYVASHLLRHHLPDDPAPAIAAVADRHARVAAVLDDFHHRLLTESRRTPFPTADLEAAERIDLRGPEA
ncbi:hypothetical protein AB0K14_25715 [Actinosynnema sp. NPDC050801]|uniref:hypothetical protein n=1 Tax=unclassified Actinosynnema TaxID=2637065 RepID=UPI003409C0F9